MHSYELTERGKIALAILIAIVILTVSIILAVLTFRNNASETTPPEVANNISAPDLNEIEPQPPEPGGFTPSDDSSDEPSDYTPEIDPLDEYSNDYSNIDNQRPNNIGNPTVNLTTGRFTFFFSLNIQTSLDYETGLMLDKFLTSPRNIPSSIIAIETPKLSNEDTTSFMSVITGALGERKIDSERITHIIDPDIPLGEHIEVNLYYIIRDEK